MDKKDILSFKGRVVVITGAGGGLGRVYALEFAKRGANVVVNDLGGTLGGSGSSSKAADLVVKEIKEKYKVNAIANYNSVDTDGDKIVKSAIDTFGRIDVLVNNAGILRDVSFAKMTQQQFKAVIDVHLNGAYKITKAAWPYMRNQKFGRIINTASPAGLFGNYGQANYSAAKMGLIGLSETLAKEGFKYNITVNSIAPLARSRMTENVIPSHILKYLSPEKIAPLVLYLCHENTNVTNSIFELAAGFYSQIRWERSSGQIFNPNPETYTPEAILLKWNLIIDFKDKKFNKVDHPIQLADYNKLINQAKLLPTNNEQSKQLIKSLKNKVVIVTGAGSGLGKSHALWFAKYGAKVVVNDLLDSSKVVDEIRSKFGKDSAIMSKHNVVTQAPEIVSLAVQTYGSVHVVINNAGILRDKSFLKMTDAEWNAVLQMHIESTYSMCKAVWPVFLKQKSGYIVNTSSTSGIYGNFGQANYASAKAAILGFSKTLAIEGLKKGIIVNTIAPHAETAMTKTIFSEKELSNHFEPSQVSPFVVLLCSDELKQLNKTPVTGRLFEVGGGWCSETRWQRSAGFVSTSENISPEIIRGNWQKLIDFKSNVSNPSSTGQSSMSILQSVQNAIDTATTKDVYSYDHKDCILYNLGVGCTSKELSYVYENDPNFHVLPTFMVLPGFLSAGKLQMNKLMNNFDYRMLLHGEQYLRIEETPIKTKGKLITNTKVVQVVDKGGKAALVVGGYETFDVDTKIPVAYSEGSYFIRGASVPEDKKITNNKRPDFAIQSFVPPSTLPDFETDVTTNTEQAALYRLSGDYNPLHIDPKLAQAVGFSKPILHGLCTLGICSKAITEKFGLYKELKVRFTGVVFPGDTLKIKAWKQPNNIVIFQAIDITQGTTVLNNAAVKLLESASKL